MSQSTGAGGTLTMRLQDALEASGTSRMRSAHPVNEPMIAMWADALGDTNPVYTDHDAALASGRRSVIAPPTMLQAWSMPKLSRMARGMRDVPGYAPYWDDAPAGPRRAEPSSGVYRILAEHGFTTSLATNCRQTYHRELVPGDHMTVLTSVDAVSDEKSTAAGVGHFVTTRLDYVDQHEECVATQLWTVLRFRPPAQGEQAGARRPARPRPTPTEPAAQAPRGPLSGRPRIGRRTEVRTIPITPTFVVATALATHDFYAIHHDVDWARSIGQPDIFTNILTTTGLVGGVFTDWAGPSGRLRSLDLRLLVPNYPGDELALSGTVTAIDGDEVTLAVVGTNRRGVHVQAGVVGTVP